VRTSCRSTCLERIEASFGQTSQAKDTPSVERKTFRRATLYTCKEA